MQERLRRKSNYVPATTLLCTPSVLKAMHLVAEIRSLVLPASSAQQLMMSKRAFQHKEEHCRNLRRVRGDCIGMVELLAVIFR